MSAELEVRADPHRHPARGSSPAYVTMAATLVTATIDERLDENAFIVPGLGDAGDRLFGPR